MRRERTRLARRGSPLYSRLVALCSERHEVLAQTDNSSDRTSLLRDVRPQPEELAGPSARSSAARSGRARSESGDRARRPEPTAIWHTKLRTPTLVQYSLYSSQQGRRLHVFVCVCMCMFVMHHVWYAHVARVYDTYEQRQSGPPSLMTRIHAALCSSGAGWGPSYKWGGARI